MKRTITIEIINNKALKLLRELESMNLIKMRNVAEVDWSKLKGSMTKQPIEEVDRQLKELRDSWERSID